MDLMRQYVDSKLKATLFSKLIYKLKKVLLIKSHQVFPELVGWHCPHHLMHYHIFLHLLALISEENLITKDLNVA